MHATWKAVVRGQFGAAIDMLENAITTCPEELWGNRPEHDAFWYIAYHTLFFLDCYLAASADAYVPPRPFTRDELDERGLLPERAYSRDQLLAFLAHGRSSFLEKVATLTEEEAVRRCGFPWLDMPVSELLLYNMRHVQHHAAQLNLLLRQHGCVPPAWVRQVGSSAGGGR